jgi:hypothetical protein
MKSQYTPHDGDRRGRIAIRLDNGNTLVGDTLTAGVRASLALLPCSFVATMQERRES